MYASLYSILPSKVNISLFRLKGQPASMLEFDKFEQLNFKIMNGNEILAWDKGQSSVINLQNFTHNNPNIYLINFKCICYILLNSIHSYFGY